MFDAKYGFDEYGRPQHGCHFDTVSEQQQIAKQVFENPGRLANTWNAEAARWGRLAEKAQPGSSMRETYLRKAKQCLAFALELSRPTNDHDVKEFYRECGIHAATVAMRSKSMAHEQRMQLFDSAKTMFEIARAQ